MSDNDWLKKLKAGDKVLVERSSHYGIRLLPRRVHRVTKQNGGTVEVMVGAGQGSAPIKFDMGWGRQRGHHGFWPDRLVEPTPANVAKAVRQGKETLLQHRVDRLTNWGVREALTNEQLDGLLAATEFLGKP